MSVWNEIVDAVSFFTMLFGAKLVWGYNFFSIFFWIGIFLVAIGVSGIRAVTIAKYKEKEIEKEMKAVLI